MKVLVAGPGAFGVKHIEALKQIDRVELATLAGGDAETGKALCETYGMPHWAPDLTTALQDTKAQAAILAILGSRKIVEQSYRSCLGVMSLAKRAGGMARLEDTCGRALAATPAPSYTLIKKLWAGWTPAPTPPPPSLGDGGFVRGADYYQNQESHHAQ